MNLYILRHGLAVERGAAGYAKEADRPLTPKGERKLWRIAEALEALELKFDIILSSPYLRARRTAEIIAEALGHSKKLDFAAELTPHGNPKRLIDFINTLEPSPDNVWLVGHEPYLSEMVSVLLSGKSHLPITLRKGGLCKLVCENLEYDRCASLEWLLAPKQMALMSK